MKKRNKIKIFLGGMILCLLLGLSGTSKAYASNEKLILGNPTWINENKFKLSDLVINSSDDIKTVIVSMSAGQLIKPTVTSQMTINKNIGNDMYTFTYSSKQKPATVQEFLKTLEFEYATGQQIEIKLDANETNIPKNATITNGTNGHYYMYVEYPENYHPVTNKNEMDWIVAYNSAKTYSYLGMKGYLATITSAEEDVLLKKISNQGAWAGGTRVLKNDGKKISDIENLNISNLANTTNPGNSAAAKKEFYWTCGPEAGNLISSSRYENWNDGEPNFGWIQNEQEYESYLQINFGDSRKWNDLCRTYTNEKVKGYFVEFGGYGQYDPGYNQVNTGEQIASGSLNVESYKVTKSIKYLSSVTITGLPETIKLNQDLKFNVKQSSSWNIRQKNIVVKIGGKTLLDTEYTYDSTTGKVTVDGKYVDGEVEVTVTPDLVWYEDNNPALTRYLKATTVTKDDNEKLSSLNREWSSLTDDAKKYVAEKTGETVQDITIKLNAMATASQFVSDNANDIETIKDISKLDPNTINELRSKINDIQTKYDTLDQKSKSYLGDLSAKLNDLNLAQDFCDTYKEIFNTQPINKSAVDQLEDLDTNYEKLTETQKALAKDTYNLLKDKLVASMMLKNHDDIISKKPVINVNDNAEDVIQSINAALDAYNNLTDNQKNQIDPLVKTDLENKLDAGQWVDGISDILSKDKVDQSDLKNISDSINSYDNLDEAVKAQIDQSIISKLKDQEAAAKWSENHKDIISKEIVDNTDFEAIEAAISSYNDLSENQKNYINSDVFDALNKKLDVAKWATDNQEIISNEGPMKADDINAVKKALSEYENLGQDEQQFVNPDTISNLKDKLVVTDMLVENPILSDNIENIDYKRLDELKKGMEAYDTLTPAQKELVSPTAKEMIEAVRNADAWLNDHEAILEKDIINKDDLDAINKAIGSYDELDNDAKKLIDPSILEDLNAKKNASQWSNQFDDILSKDLEDINAEDLGDLRKAMDAYNKLSDSEKSFIDPSIIENALEAQKNAFIDKFLSDKEGNMYDKLTSDNYEQILSGKSDWLNMSQSEKDKINKVVKEKMGCTYEELIADAEELKESVNSFIDKYLTGKDGNIYKDSDSSNYNQILSGLDSWNKMSQDEKNAINDILKANGGKTYEELLASAKALKEATDGFINKYLTGKDGQIYKVANKSNYSQILSGKDSWNKMSQDEKNAINDILKANGGKTYEELLELANLVKKSVETGDETNIMPLYMLVLSSLLGGYIAIKKRSII